MDLAQIAQAAGGGGFLYAVLKLVEWSLKTWTDRRTAAANEGKLRAESTKLTGESRVSESADYREWAKRADERAQRAENRLDALRDEFDELKDQHEELVRQISLCRAGSSCPVAAAVNSK